MPHDRVLAALIDQLEAERELAAITALPYEQDPDLCWQAPAGPDLPYDGPVPEEVLRLTAPRRSVPEDGQADSASQLDGPGSL